MKKLALFGLFIVFGFFSLNATMTKPSKILVMFKTNGFHHTSIPVGVAAIQQLGRENGFDVDTTTESDIFTYKTLSKYAAIIFLNTSGTILNAKQKKGFQSYIRSGGGFVGVHAATDTEFEWPWYNQMIGAWFKNHPKQQMARLLVKDRHHPSTKHLPAIWERKDEWYNFKDINSDIHVLITIDEKSYEGGTNGGFHPIAWYHNFEGGSVFYTALGHREDAYSDPAFLKHLLGGIVYAARLCNK